MAFSDDKPSQTTPPLTVEFPAHIEVYFGEEYDPRCYFACTRCRRDLGDVAGLYTPRALAESARAAAEGHTCAPLTPSRPSVKTRVPTARGTRGV